MTPTHIHPAPALPAGIGVAEQVIAVAALLAAAAYVVAAARLGCST
ncbi:hypothetical protein ABZ934_29985 [Streptomyces sp. NPDC046557]